MFGRNGCKYVQRATYKGGDHLSVSAMESVCIHTYVEDQVFKTPVIKFVSRVTVVNCNLDVSITNQRKQSIQVEFFLLLQAP